MKIIFLDVDGVLNNARWARKMYDEGVHVYADDLLYDPSIKQLKRLIDATNAKVILSSSWRNHPDAMEHLEAQLNAYNIFIYGKTPRVGPQRGDDITAWFNRYDKAGLFKLRPEEYNYIILDDDSDMTVHMDHLVKTDFETGLQYTHVDRAIALLNGEAQNGN